MPFFTHIPSGIPLRFAFVISWRSLLLSTKDVQIGSGFKNYREDFGTKSSRDPHQQESTLELTGSAIPGEREGINVGQHCSACGTRTSAGLKAKFPWLQAHHVG